MNELQNQGELKRTLSLPLLIGFGLAYLAPTVVFNYYGIWTADVDFSTVMGEADEGLAEALKDVTVQLELDLRSDNSVQLHQNGKRVSDCRFGLCIC